MATLAADGKTDSLRMSFSSAAVPGDGRHAVASRDSADTEGREAELQERLAGLREALEFVLDAREPYLLETQTARDIHALRQAQADPFADVTTPLIAALQSSDPEVREYAAEFLRRFPSPRAVVPLLPLLADESAWVRIETVETLGFLRDSAAVPALLALIHDDEPAVRVNLAEALGTMRDRSPATVRALIAMLEDDEPVVRAFSAEALGDMGDESALPALQARLSDKPVVRVWVLYALARLGRGLDWAGVQRVLRHGDAAARFQAVVVLRLLATERLAPRVAEMIHRALRRETVAELRATMADCIHDMQMPSYVPVSTSDDSEE